MTRPAGSESRQPDDPQIPDNDCGTRTPRQYLSDVTRLQTRDWSRNRHC